MDEHSDSDFNNYSNTFVFELYSFKYQNIYYVFRNKYNKEKYDLSNKILNELKNMSAQNWVQMKNLVDKIPIKYEFMDIEQNNFNGIFNVLSNPNKFDRIETEITETDGYSNIGYKTNSVCIIDLDQNQFVIKKITYNEPDQFNFPQIDKEIIQVISFNNIVFPKN